MSLGAPTPRVDVFICHASEDKADIARPLAEELAARGWLVWYDEFELTAGDSLEERINDGLGRARYGVVILSQNFFKKNWARRELNALAAKEAADGRKVILPVWHNVTKPEVDAYSPLLADKLAVPSSHGLAWVVAELSRALVKGGLRPSLAASQEFTASVDNPAERSRHPKKDVERAVSEAMALGWTLRRTKGHAWAVMTCPSSEDLMTIWASPRQPAAHARQIRRAVVRCPHNAIAGS